MTVAHSLNIKKNEILYVFQHVHPPAGGLRGDGIPAHIDWGSAVG